MFFFFFLEGGVAFSNLIFYRLDEEEEEEVVVQHEKDDKSRGRKKTNNSRGNYGPFVPFVQRTQPLFKRTVPLLSVSLKIRKKGKLCPHLFLLCFS